MTLEHANDSNEQIESLSTDDLDIGDADFLSTGDAAFIGPSLPPRQRTFSTTSTSYVRSLSFFFHRIQWSAWLPSGAQSCLLAEFQLSGTDGDTRLRNKTDSDTVFEVSDKGASNENIVEGPTNYTPPTTGSSIKLEWQLRSNDGASSTDLNDLSCDLGVRV